MKAVERYRAELDDTKTPAALQEKLLAIPAQYPLTAPVDAAAATPMQQTTPAAAEAPDATTATPQPKGGKFISFGKTIPFTLPKGWKKQALAAAACFVVGVFATDALDLQVIPRMGTNSADSAAYDTVYTSGSTSATTGGTMTSNNIDSAALLEDGATISLTDSAVSFEQANPTESATEAEYDTRSTEDTSTEDNTSRKIIYTTSIRLETMAYDDTIAALSIAVSEAGGYLETSELYGGSSYGNAERSAYFTYRIPAENYNSFLAGISEVGSITYQNESANDVTTSYLDLEARITTLTQQRDRLWELQQEAEDLSDLLEIEATLTDVLYQIESYQSQLNYLADQVDYATISIYLDEVIEYTVSEPTVWQTITGTFTGAITSFGATVGAFFLFVLSLWVWIALALIVFFVYNSIKKKNAKNKM